MRDGSNSGTGAGAGSGSCSRVDSNVTGWRQNVQDSILTMLSPRPSSPANSASSFSTSFSYRTGILCHLDFPCLRRGSTSVSFHPPLNPPKPQKSVPDSCGGIPPRARASCVAVRYRRRIRKARSAKHAASKRRTTKTPRNWCQTKRRGVRTTR